MKFRWGFALLLAASFLFAGVSLTGMVRANPPASASGVAQQGSTSISYFPWVMKQATPTPTFTPTPTATSTPQPTSTPTVTFTPTRIPPAVEVGKSGNTFNPSDLTINLGETVKWTWYSDGHTVTSSDQNGNPNGQFCSPDNTNCNDPSRALMTGAVYLHTFTAKGDYYYVCLNHRSEGMKGVIHVK